MKHFLRWVSPLILGVIEFYFLRLATDPSRGTEWWPDFNNQLREFKTENWRFITVRKKRLMWLQN